MPSPKSMLIHRGDDTMRDDTESYAEIYNAATLLIDQHGESAAAVASCHLDAVREHGDRYSASRWSRILAMIEKLQVPSEAADLADGVS